MRKLMTEIKPGFLAENASEFKDEVIT